MTSTSAAYIGRIIGFVWQILDISKIGIFDCKEIANRKMTRRKQIEGTSLYIYIYIKGL
jgi:hypothetical protein